MVGIAEHVGHQLTYKVLTQDTHKVIARSELCPVRTGTNRRVDLLRGEDFDPLKPPTTEFLKDRNSKNSSNMSDGSLDITNQDNPQFSNQ